MKKKIEELFRDSIRTKTEFLTPANIAGIEAMAEAVVAGLTKGGKLLVCGNGGSASDAAHFAGELVGRFLKERPAISAVALNTDMSTLTAVANDYGFNRVFGRQVEALGRPGDVLFILSTSGNSPNLLDAANMAKKKGLATLGLLGRDGGKVRDMLDYALVVPATLSPRIQEIHITVIHILCDLVESALNP
jgi:D-sedoheptulose 7-phosphate isomerase